MAIVHVSSGGNERFENKVYTWGYNGYNLLGQAGFNLDKATYVPPGSLAFDCKVAKMPAIQALI